MSTAEDRYRSFTIDSDGGEWFSTGGARCNLAASTVSWITVLYLV